MNPKFFASAVALTTVLSFATPSFAGLTTVDISSYVNSNVDINAATIPIGLSNGNQGTGISFNIAQYTTGSGVAGTWNPDFAPGSSVGKSIVGTMLTVDLSSFHITGQASFYALLNNYFGTPGADEYDITIKATNGNSVTYKSIGGVDTRDYNSNVFTNTIANTTSPWFDNGIGQRLDVREFALPAFFASDTIASFGITQVTQGAHGDAALFSGLTFSDQPPAAFGTPEPSSLLTISIGLFSVGLVLRRLQA